MSFIETASLIFRYKLFSGEKEPVQEKTVLDDISLQIEKGDFVGILGHNGSGKSTLAKQLTALLKPSEGAVYIKGMDTAQAENTLSIRKTAGIVFQNPDNQLIGSTVEEDVAFGLENLGVPTDQMWNRISAALEATGMSAYKMTSPLNLSGGQKQRVAISGILAMEPECIIFDEPTAMLDPAGREEIMRAVRYLNREKKITILYITHHTDEVWDADYLYVMNQGKLVLSGKPDQLWEQADQLKAYKIALPHAGQLIKKLRDQGLSIPPQVKGEDQLLTVLSGLDDKALSAILPFNADRKFQVRQEDMEAQPGICLEHISYTYDNQGKEDKNFALCDVSLTIRPGEYVAIAGQTGSGKSTLLQHLNGLLAPSEGRYYFDGQDVHEKDYPIKALRQKVGLCFQYPEYQLFEENVLKDIAFGPKNLGLDQEACLKKAREAMELTGLPAELETISPFSLSGGQKRRVALAGILAMEPEYLILDEPVAGLDQEGKERLFDLLAQLNKEKNVTIILVSHDMEDVAAHAERVILMKDGRIVCDGPAETVLSAANRKTVEEAGLHLPYEVEFYDRLCRKIRR